MQLDHLDEILAAYDLTVPYLVVCWIAAAGAVLEMQKIGRKEVMTRVWTPVRHGVRFLLAVLFLTLLWSGYAPLRYQLPPWPSDMALVGSLTLVLFAHAITGCRWARLPPQS